MSERITPDTDEFTSALHAHAARYGVDLKESDAARLRAYYEHVVAWNARLHLVAPCSPTEFVTRHVLESLLALPHLSKGARVADVGSGAGLPIIPCLILRPDLHATLVEASVKKAVFLREALRRVDAHNSSSRSKVIAERFEKLPTPEVDFVTCRALDRFKEMLERLIKWSPPDSTLLLFGSPALREQIERLSLSHTAVRMPDSEQRFLFVVKNHSKV